MAIEDEFFGAPPQISVMRRGMHLWTLLSDNPRYGCNGRMVVLVDPGIDAAGQAKAVARLQGAGACHYVPEAESRPAYDQIIQGASGVMSITGDAQSAPMRVGYPIADTVGGMTAAFAICAALNSEERGSFIDVSMLESVIATMGRVVSNHLIAGVAP